MLAFTPDDLNAIDAIWRSLPPHHIWTGWAAAGEAPERIFIFRKRAHWRRFTLTKTHAGFALADERGQMAAEAQSLGDLLAAVEAIPGLETLHQD